MPKPIPTAKALAVVKLLGKQPTTAQIQGVAEHMTNWLTVSAVLAGMKTAEESTAMLRAMLAYEICREGGPRDMIVHRLYTRHERIAQALRMEAMAKTLPAIADGLRTRS